LPDDTDDRDDDRPEERRDGSVHLEPERRYQRNEVKHQRPDHEVEDAEREARDRRRDELDDRPDECVDDAENEAGEQQRNVLVGLAKPICRAPPGDARHEIRGDGDRDRVDERAPDDAHA
jgi:hypothetical protein